MAKKKDDPVDASGLEELIAMNATAGTAVEEPPIKPPAKQVKEDPKKKEEDRRKILLAKKPDELTYEEIIELLDNNVAWPAEVPLMKWVNPDFVTPFDDPMFAYTSMADLLDQMSLAPSSGREMLLTGCRVAAHGYGLARWVLGGKIVPGNLQPWLMETLNYLHGHRDPITRKFYNKGDFKAVFNPKEKWKQDGETWVVFSYPATVVVYDYSHRLGWNPANRKVISLTNTHDGFKRDVLICHPKMVCGMVIGSDQV